MAPTPNLWPPSLLSPLLAPSFTHPCGHQPTHPNSVPPANSHPRPPLRPRGTHTGCTSVLRSLGKRTEQILRNKQAWKDRRFWHPGRSTCGLEREVTGSEWAPTPDFWGHGQEGASAGPSKARAQNRGPRLPMVRAFIVNQGRQMRPWARTGAAPVKEGTEMADNSMCRTWRGDTGSSQSARCDCNLRLSLAP